MVPEGTTLRDAYGLRIALKSSLLNTGHQLGYQHSGIPEDETSGATSPAKGWKGSRGLRKETYGDRILGIRLQRGAVKSLSSS